MPAVIPFAEYSERHPNSQSERKEYVAVAIHLPFQ
jgi:hypothetical protein